MIGLLLTLQFFATRGGDDFLGIPIRIIFWPGMLSYAFIARPLGLSQDWAGPCALLFLFANMVGYGLMTSVIYRGYGMREHTRG